MPAIIRPIITEKTMQAVPDGHYTFEVSQDTNKIEVAKEIKSLYKVEPKEVRILNVKGKVKIFKRVPGRRSDVKKAVVTLKSGDKIPGFEMDTTSDKDKK
jgi:large subunit ribosomal protein L23